MGGEFGDYQTPVELVARVIACLGSVLRDRRRVLEPTCGSGSFIKGLIESSSTPEEIIGIELQEEHFKLARRIERGANGTLVRIRRANLFDLNLGRDLRWQTKGPLLVIGNPPWVTSSDLGAIESWNIPAKTNLKGLRGIDALTGSSNFDLAEYIWLKLIRELEQERPAIALLCKTSVARNVLQFARDQSLPVISSWIRRVDARRYFNASVDACLFYIETGEGGRRYEAAVFKDLEAPAPERVIGFAAGRAVFDLGRYRKSASLDGKCPFAWRQGIKHDAARIMELRSEGKRFINGMGEPVDVEPDYLFPLLKSADLNRETPRKPRLSVIVTQRRIAEDTTLLEIAAPKLWRYLTLHEDHFNRRKSSIYRGRPRFSMFGIGGYSFSPFKVAVSGLHREPCFRLIGPVEGRPVMLDDTCYFIACESARQAALLAALLNHRYALEFLRAIIFPDSKRPVTKSVLQRMAILELLRLVSGIEALRVADRLLAQTSQDYLKEDEGWPGDLRSLLSPSVFE